MTQPINSVMTVSDLYDLFGEAIGKALLNASIEYETVEQVLQDAEEIVKRLIEEKGLDDSQQNLDQNNIPNSDQEAELRNGIFNFCIHLSKLLMTKYNIQASEAREGVATYLSNMAAGLRQLNEEDSQTTKEETE